MSLPDAGFAVRKDGLPCRRLGDYARTTRSILELPHPNRFKSATITPKSIDGLIRVNGWRDEHVSVHGGPDRWD